MRWLDGPGAVEFDSGTYMVKRAKSFKVSSDLHTNIQENLCLRKILLFIQCF